LSNIARVAGVTLSLEMDIFIAQIVLGLC